MEQNNTIIEAEFSSPSKIILSGEHSVVYGHPAIAFAVGPLSVAKSEESQLASRTKCVVTVIDNLNKEHPFLNLKSALFELKLESVSDLSHIENKSEYEQLAINMFMEAAKQALSESQDTLLETIADKYSISFEVKFGVPVGAGLGSSASFNSVFSGAVYTVMRALSSTHELPNEITYSENDIKVVKSLTDHGEKLVHGNPSGIDSFIINNGGIVRYIKNPDGSIDYTTDIKLPTNLNFDIIFTGVSRSTKTSLTNMLKLKQAFPGECLYIFLKQLIVSKLTSLSTAVFETLVNSIATVTKEFEELLNNKEIDSQKLVYLVNVNHKLLQALQLSVPIIEKLTIIADEHKVGLKITGAGCGGCLLAVYSETSDIDGFKSACYALSAEGVKVIEAEQTNDGFRCDSWSTTSHES